MKTNILLLFLLLSGVQLLGQNCNSVPNSSKSNATSVGIVIYSNDTETVWNAFRLANYSKNEGDTVCVFLLGKGVEVDKLVIENKDIKEQANQFLDSGGKILGCGTCLQNRNNNEPKICKFSSMSDLYELIRESKVVLTF
jgi:predicted peroxiredoxin